MWQVGDKIKIKDNLEVGKVYGLYEFVKGMKKYAGKIAVITEEYRVSIISEDVCFLLDIDDGSFGWSKEMLEPINEKVSGQVIWQ